MTMISNISGTHLSEVLTLTEGFSSGNDIIRNSMIDSDKVIDLDEMSDDCVEVDQESVQHKSQHIQDKICDHDGQKHPLLLQFHVSQKQLDDCNAFYMKKGWRKREVEMLKKNVERYCATNKCTTSDMLSVSRHKSAEQYRDIGAGIYRTLYAVRQ